MRCKYVVASTSAGSGLLYFDFHQSITEHICVYESSQTINILKLRFDEQF